MKNARVCLWNAKATQNPKAPILSGSVQLPAQLVWELSQLLQANQGFEINPKPESNSLSCTLVFGKLMEQIMGLY